MIERYDPGYIVSIKMKTLGPAQLKSCYFSEHCTTSSVLMCIKEVL